MKLWSCPYCGLEAHDVHCFDVVVQHLWEEHKCPSFFAINGEVHKAGPQFPPLKWLLQRIAK